MIWITLVCFEVMAKKNPYTEKWCEEALIPQTYIHKGVYFKEKKYQKKRERERERNKQP